MEDLLTPIEKVFAHKILRIPDYQRGYAWGERQWKDFINDLEFLPENKKHYTGTIVIHAIGGGTAQLLDNQANTYTIYEIVDGQQRLATAVLLMDAVRREMEKIEDLRGFAKGIVKNYIEIQDRNNHPIPRLKLNEDCQEFFYLNVLERGTWIEGPTIQSHVQLEQAKAFFSEYLLQKREILGDLYPEFLEGLFLKVTTQLGLIVYPIQKETEAGVIFESMNDRGKPISELEKIKNFLIYRVGMINLPDEHNLIKKINKTWKYIFEQLMNADLVRRSDENQFLRAFWLMAFNYRRESWIGARSFKGHFSLERYQYEDDSVLMNDLDQFLDLLKSAATAYSDILNPAHSNAFSKFQHDSTLRHEIKEEASRFARLEALAGFLPLLIATRIRFKNDGEANLQVMRHCEKYAFRVYRWLGSPVSRGQPRLFRLGYDLFKFGDLENILHSMEGMIHRDCSDTQFQDRFRSEGINWYRWYWIKYFLYEYEDYLARQAGIPVRMTWEYLAKSNKEKTIEHILPQTPDEEGYWEARFNPEQYQKYINDIGNLTVTFDNSSLGNKSFPEKKGKPGKPKCYAGSKLHVEQQIAIYEDWTEESILSRRKEIEDWTLQRWFVSTPTEVEEKDEPMERILTMADRSGVGNEMRALVKAAESLPIDPIAKKKCMRFCPNFNWNLSLFTVYPEIGFFWFIIRPRNFIKFKGANEQEIYQLFGTDKWQRKQKEDVDQFINNLERFFAGLT